MCSIFFHLRRILERRFTERFEPDYVDPRSGLAACHLTLLLNAIAPRSTLLNEAALAASVVVDAIEQQVQFRLNLIA